MVREIYEVYAQIVDANGNFADLQNYPKVVDSKNYDNNIDRAKMRAYAYLYDALAKMGVRDDRQLQFATIIRVNDGQQIALECFGRIADLPDPPPPEEAPPEPEPEPEPTEEETPAEQEETPEEEET